MNPLLFILILNFSTQFLLFIFNILKSNFDMPLFFKSISFIIVLIVNIIVGLFFLYASNLQTQIVSISYFLIVFIICFIHFILDEDIIYIFNKGTVVSISEFLVLFLFVSWYILLF